MRKVTATFRVTTPMFLAGVDQDQAELRLPAIKGALRFWWRALNYGRYGGDLRQIYQAESQLFGGVGREAGQSSILMRIASPPPAFKRVSRGQVYERMEGMPGARYLGYGVMEAFDNARKGTRAGQLQRGCLQAPFDFTLELCCRGEVHTSVKDALKALGLFGGLGSRSRKGYGGLTLLSLKDGEEEIWKRPESRDAFATAVRELVARPYLGEPEYTAFSTATRIIMVKEGSDPVQLLNDVGMAMQMYRSYGLNGKVNRKPAEQNFKDDHDLMLKAAQGTRPPSHPRRVVFGLPHNYYFSSSKLKVDVKPEHQDRRASPLFIHIHEFSRESYAAILTVLPARFLPVGENINIICGQNKFQVRPHPDFSVIKEFIDGYTGPAGNKTGSKRFPGALEVGPRA